MTHFVQQQVNLSRQDFGRWRAKQSRRRRGLSDLFNGRSSVERTEVIATLRFLGLIALAYLLIYALVSFIPVGFDWIYYFGRKILPPFWVPWAMPVLEVVSPQTLSAVAILAAALRIRQFHGSMWRLPLVVISLPMLWLLFKSDVDGLALLGLVTLPWGVPLLLLKPQIGVFALLAKRSSFIAGAVWGLISIAIWGLWFARLQLVSGAQWHLDWPQDISLFPWGLLIAVPLMWLGRGDEDMLMAAGSFATPHLFPYHFVLIMPALGRVSRLWAAVAWLVSFLPLLANFLGPAAWHLGNLTGLTIWLGLYLQRRRQLNGRQVRS